jgi:hypothetical protein
MRTLSDSQAHRPAVTMCKLLHIFPSILGPRQDSHGNFEQFEAIPANSYYRSRAEPLEHAETLLRHGRQMKVLTIGRRAEPAYCTILHTPPVEWRRKIGLCFRRAT